MGLCVRDCVEISRPQLISATSEATGVSARREDAMQWNQNVAFPFDDRERRKGIGGVIKMAAAATESWMGADRIEFRGR
jgi:hypothetical protein